MSWEGRSYYSSLPVVYPMPPGWVKDRTESYGHEGSYSRQLYRRLSDGYVTAQPQNTPPEKPKEPEKPEEPEEPELKVPEAPKLPAPVALNSPSRAAWNVWQTHGKQALDQLSREFAPENRGSRIAAQQQLATAEVGRSYDDAEANYRRAMERYNLNPGSGRFAAGLRQLALGRAGDTAGARTEARIGVLERGQKGLAGIAELGQRFADMGMRGDIATNAQRLQQSLGRAGLEMQRYGMQLDYDLGRRGDDTNRYRIDKDFELGKASGDLARAQHAAQRRDARRSRWAQGIGAVIGLFSDRRMKRNVRQIGEIEHGLKVYEFSYHKDPDKRMFTGLMADEVAAVWPQHVGVEQGYQVINYDGVFRELAK